MRQAAIIGMGFSQKIAATEIKKSLQFIVNHYACLITAISTPEFKKNDINVQNLQQILTSPVHFIPNETLHTLQTKCQSFSEKTFKYTGFGAIAEACALALMTQNDHLLIPKMIYNNITFSIAIKGYFP